MRAFLIGSFLLAANAVHACPDGSTILVSCTFNGGASYLETCLMGDHATYAYGESDRKPELALARHVRDVDMTPWPGIGKSIWEAFTFENGGYSYTAHYAIKKDPGAESPMSGGIIVDKDGQQVASRQCDTGSVSASGYSLPLFEAKEAAGQIYSPETQSWR
ncbi:hypothetical protein K3555_13980 [Leisingera sp. M527]|uniref:hypothetical protein n=1 Tax=unclassified Leisingera TaxID=2614906 RepID=UPI0021A39723|nr:MULTISPECIES: hypothetical protein [unclassified Leisingera]UWQ27607.1 hypothetical protein K3557_12395 [Leisingera sp. M523]UWQ31698.1 hypothetical protein K3555_13980 [Leisingera sp. M527]